MTVTTKQLDTIVDILNDAATISIQSIIPIPFQRNVPITKSSDLHLGYGVLIGLTGDIKGNIVLAAESSFFQTVANTMYGFPLEGEMLTSFTGELGNMIAGGLTTGLVNEGITVNITPPTIIEGETKLIGNKKTTELVYQFENHLLSLYFMLDR